MSAAHSIRRAGAGDSPALARLAALTFPLACPPHVTAEAIELFLAANLSEERFDSYLADPERAVFVAVDAARRLVGYTLLVMGEPYDADVAAAITTRPTSELSKLYVHPEAHGGGIASRLVEATVAEARARGAAAVWLGVNQHNARANRFYEKSGFAQVGVKRFLVGDRYEDDFVREFVFSSAGERLDVAR